MWTLLPRSDHLLLCGHRLLWCKKLGFLLSMARFIHSKPHHIYIVSVRKFRISPIYAVWRAYEGHGEIFLGIFPDEDGNPLADWSMKSPNSVHKHAIFVQDFPESLIANEHLNRAIHDAVGQNASGIPRIGGCCEFSDRHCNLGVHRNRKPLRA